MSVFFLGSRGNISERGTNKSRKQRIRSWTICLFRASIHLEIEFYLFVSHGGMKRQRVHV